MRQTITNTTNTISQEKLHMFNDWYNCSLGCL